MTRWKKPLLALSALVAALAFSLPAAAQQAPTGDAPVRPDPALNAAVCVPTGTALAVLAGDATVAKVIGTPVRAATDVAAATRVITLDRPGVVGACAQFNGFWADGVAGLAAVHLQLFGANDTTTALAEDGWRGQQTGPFVQAKGLRALTKLDKPGTYPFVAVLSVQAGTADPTSSQAGNLVKDARRIPFTVIVRGKGSISGVVRDAAGVPIAGAVVRAQPPASVTPRGGVAELPIIGAEPQDDQPNPADRAAANTAVTDKDGNYKIALPTGKYLVTAQARGFKPQWFDGKDNAKDATPVELTADAPHRADVNFALMALSPSPDPQPRGKGKITGVVTDGAGAPIAGAGVQATMGANAAGASRGMSAVTGPEGRYELVVPAGKWVVMAKAPLFKPQWYSGKAEAAAADPVEVADGATVADVSFSLAAAPRATITGVVTDKDNNPVAKAPVMAVKRPQPPTPLTAEGERDPAQGPMVYTDETGAYSLVVEPGTWAVGAGPAMNARSSTLPPITLWWDNKLKLAEADLLTLADGETATGISFQLK